MTCGDYPSPYDHIYDGGNVHPYNSYVGERGTFPEGHTCMCGKEVWHNMTLEESFNLVKKNYDRSSMHQ